MTVFTMTNKQLNRRSTEQGYKQGSAPEKSLKTNLRATHTGPRACGSKGSPAKGKRNITTTQLIVLTVLALSVVPSLASSAAENALESAKPSGFSREFSQLVRSIECSKRRRLGREKRSASLQSSSPERNVRLRSPSDPTHDREHRTITGNMEHDKDKLTVKCATFNLGHPYHNPHHQLKLGKKSWADRYYNRTSELKPMLQSLVDNMLKEGQPNMLVFGFQEARVKTGRKVFFFFGGKAKAENWRSLKRVKKTLNKILRFYGYKIKAKYDVNGAGSKGIYLFIAVKNNSQLRIENLKCKRIRYGRRDYCSKGWWTGKLKWRGNKGAALIKMTVTNIRTKKTTDVSFLNCHNAANSAEHNVLDFKACVALSNTYAATHQIIMGDLNPRLYPEDRTYSADLKRQFQDAFGGKWMRSTKLKAANKENPTPEELETQRQKIQCRDQMYNEMLNPEWDSTPNVTSNSEQEIFQKILCADTNFQFGFEVGKPVPDSLKDAFEAEAKKRNGFNEEIIKFAPSYPFSPDKNIYDPDKGKGKGRILSYCDRILYKSADDRKSDIRCTDYGCYIGILGSDHRPVHASFTITLREKCEKRNTNRSIELQPMNKHRRRVTLE